MLRPLGFVAVFSISLAAGRARAQGTEQVSVESLISRLSSASFRQRVLAVESLKGRPDAVEELRAAARTADIETRRRLEEIIDYHERRPLRELAALAESGRIGELVNSVAKWPAGKYDADVWAIVRGSVRKVCEIHEKKGGRKMDRTARRWDGVPPTVLSAKTVTESTKVEYGADYFVRAGEIDLLSSRKGPRMPGEYNNYLDAGAFFLASGKVRLDATGLMVILAGGPVRLPGSEVQGLVVISGGDVELDGTLYDSIIIARGAVSGTPTSLLGGNRIVSGSTVRLEGSSDAKLANIISENDSNPLGYIRWADAPKDKDAGKTPAKGGEKKQ